MALIPPTSSQALPAPGNTRQYRWDRAAVRTRVVDRVVLHQPARSDIRVSNRRNSRGRGRRLEQALVELARQGINVAPAIVTHVAPLGWAHIGLTGDYVWSDEEQPSDRALSAAQAARINARCLVVPFVLI
jgi:hypothetical protein